MTTIKAVLFDMDGVLIEAKEWHYQAFNKALNLFGISISEHDHIKTFDGLPTKKKLEILALHHDLPEERHEFINEMKQQYTMEMIHAKCKPCPIHQFALSNLQSMGYKMALCSNSIRNTVEIMMKKAELDKYFDIMISNEDVSKGKPDPEMYLKAMAYLGLHPQECLIIEDNENGIKAARAAGGHLLIVQEVNDTNFTNIIRRIKEIDENKSKEDKTKYESCTS
jgi:beta-phosphoglucomutase